jgi:hypothetical protein
MLRTIGTPLQSAGTATGPDETMAAGQALMVWLGNLVQHRPPHMMALASVATIYAGQPLLLVQESVVTRGGDEDAGNTILRYPRVPSSFRQLLLGR